LASSHADAECRHPPTVEDIADHIGEIRAEEGYVVPANLGEELQLLLKQLG
jgi:hypothetical protein